jgi:hypothetical protein
VVWEWYLLVCGKVEKKGDKYRERGYICVKKREESKLKEAQEHDIDIVDDSVPIRYSGTWQG